MALLTIILLAVYLVFWGSSTHEGVIQSVFHDKTACVVGLGIKGWITFSCLI